MTPLLSVMNTVDQNRGDVYDMIFLYTIVVSLMISLRTHEEVLVQLLGAAIG